MSGELTVLDHTTGELLDLRAVGTERLARYIDDLQQYWRQLAATETVVAEELIRRCDQQAQWTVRVNDESGRQYEIKTSSPAAGTEEYAPGALEHELRTLVDAGTLNPEGASAALKRTLSVEFAVPWDADPTALATILKQACGLQVAGAQVRVGKAEGKRTPVAAGIAKLRKIPDVAEALDRAKTRVEPPKRRVKVTLKGKGAA